MFTRKQKIGNNLSIVKPENRLLGLLKTETVFKALLGGLEKNNQVTCGESKKEIENAMLEAEYNRAKAILTTQQARAFC